MLHDALGVGGQSLPYSALTPSYARGLSQPLHSSVQMSHLPLLDCDSPPVTFPHYHLQFGFGNLSSDHVRMDLK